MFYHLIVTDDCNLCCNYCRGKLFECNHKEDNFKIDENVPSKINFDLKKLYKFLMNDKEAVLTFYGGEPLLAIDLVREIMKKAPVNRYMLQTNGLLLSFLGKEYVNKFETILVSIDGNEKITDLHRGNGVYKRVICNLKKIKEEGFKGELIARMTIDEKNDIYKDVRYLIENDDFSFSSIHWQLDANFWPDFEKRKNNFLIWIKKYNASIKKLIKYWIKQMEEGKVLRLYPFLDCTEDLLLGRKSLLRCGSGHSNFTILTNGYIVPCPIMIGMKDYYLGHIETHKPEEIKRIFVNRDCQKCEIYWFCGGRCLYSNITKPWPKEGSDLVCESVKNLYENLNNAIPKIRELIRDGKIDISDFKHTKYNGCEIIP